MFKKFFKAKIRFENKFKVVFFLNINAKINIIIRKIIKTISLTKYYNLKLELIFYINHNHYFILYGNVKVVIKGLKTWYSIFIIKTKRL